jgi:hypothetical protein
MHWVGRGNPALVSDRNVIPFIEAGIEETRKLPDERPPLAHVDAPPSLIWSAVGVLAVRLPIGERTHHLQLSTSQGIDHVG